MDPEQTLIIHPIVRRLGSHLGLEEDQELLLLNEQFSITAGFTIDRLNDLLVNIDNVTPNANSVARVIGWVFRLPSSPNGDGSSLVKDIIVKQIVARVTDQGTSIKEEELFYPGTTEVVTVTPKILYQRRTIPADDVAKSYPKSFDLTQPRHTEDTDIPVRELENYQNWIDLSLLNRSDLENFQFLLQTQSAHYNDLFVSGAKIQYATMHNPQLRVEQKTLVNKYTNELIGDDSNFPFTLKAEPYVGSPDDDFAWLRSVIETESALPTPAAEEILEGTTFGPDDQPEGIEELNQGEEEAAPDEIFDVEFPSPGTGLMSPCPPFWVYPPEIDASLKTVFPLISSEDQFAVRNAVHTALVDPTTNPAIEPINIATVKLSSIQPKGIQQPGRLNFWQRLIALVRAFVQLFFPKTNF